MSAAGKGDKPRNCFSKEFKSNYDEIFRKPKLAPVKIFFDLDECVLHSTWSKQDLEESIGGIDDFVFNLGTDKHPELYRTCIRPGAREAIAYARAQVGTENVYVLTASTKPYSNTINAEGQLGFKVEQIYHRQDISDAYSKVKDSPEFRPCILIDNLHYNSNMTKAYFLRIDSCDYHQVREFFNDCATDVLFTEGVIAFIDRRIKYYSRSENREVLFEQATIE